MLNISKEYNETSNNLKTLNKVHKFINGWLFFKFRWWSKINENNTNCILFIKFISFIICDDFEEYGLYPIILVVPLFYFT